MDVKKRLIDQGRLQVTKDQVRLAQITQTRLENQEQDDSIMFQKLLKKVIEATRCTQLEAESALLENDRNVDQAVLSIIENPEKTAWKENKTRKQTKKQDFTNENGPQINGGKQQGRRSEQPRDTRTHRGGGTRQNSSGPMAQNDRGNVNGSVSRTRGPVGDGAPSRDRAYNNTCDDQQTAQKRERSGFGPNKNFRTDDRDKSGPKGQQQRAYAKPEEGGSAWDQQQNNEEWDKAAGGGWGESVDNKEDNFPPIDTFASPSVYVTKNDEWKNGPKVFVASSLSSTAIAPSVSDSANNLHASSASASAVSDQSAKPPQLSFAAVAASKKKKELPVQLRSKLSAMSETLSENVQPPKVEQQLFPTEVESVPETDGGWGASTGTQKDEWSSSNADGWGNQTNNKEEASGWGHTDTTVVGSPMKSSVPEVTVPSTSSATFPTSSDGSPLNVNQQFTDQLKNDIGLFPSSGTNLASSAMESYMTTSAIQPSSVTSPFDYQASAPLQKVEFMTGKNPSMATSYQFGYHFDQDSSSVAASVWSPPTNTDQQHISSVELDRNVLNSSNVSVMATATNVPTSSTTTNSASAQFNSSAPAATVSYHQQQQQTLRPQQQQQSAALAYTNTASVNYPPNDVNLTGTTIGTTSAANNGPQNTSTVTNNGTKYSTNGAQMAPVVTMQHQQQLPPATIQQQQAQQNPQQMYHQASQFPTNTYNLPAYHHTAAMNMYSPVATAGIPNAEVDRFLMQQYPYMDMQFGALSMANAAQQQTPAPQQQHREQQQQSVGTGYMDLAKYQQQQSMGQQQMGAGGNLSYQHQSLSAQQSGQQQRNDAAGLQGMGGGIAPPPGFGVPTQQYLPQAPNLQSLFQAMPAYPHMGYSHTPSFVVPNRMTQQHGRPIQTPPQDGGLPTGRPMRQRYEGGGGQRGDQFGGVEHQNADHHSQQQQQSYQKYRPYM